MTEEQSKIKLPLLIWVIIVSTMVACIGGEAILGYNVSGYAWVVPLAAALFFLLGNPGRPRFPLYLWAPWVFIVLAYLLFSDAEHAFQRSIMLICPLVIGMASSKIEMNEEVLFNFRKVYRYMTMTLYAVVLLKTGILLTGALPGVTGLAPEVMTGALLSTLFATHYMFGLKKDLYWWAALAAIPVIAVTRMGIIATALSLPLTFAPMKITKRIVITAFIMAVGFAVFNTERVQHKMFISGRGTIEDLTRDNPDLATNGRKYLWQRMEIEIDKQPWFGHGANASESFSYRLLRLSHPHNDWLRLRYDYGYLGTFTFAFCMLLQVVHLIKKGRQSIGETRVLFFAGASTFVAFTLFMFTDNIILYAAFFGNFQFAILGLAYASSEEEKNQVAES